MDLSHLTGLTRLQCLEEFHGIPAGTLVPLRVWKETDFSKTQHTAPDGALCQRERRRHHMLIQITAPDGIAHRFHTDPTALRTATIAARQPAGHAPATTIHHSIESFVRHFHTPIPPGLARPDPTDHALLDLLEAITTAFLKERGLGSASSTAHRAPIAAHPSPP